MADSGIVEVLSSSFGGVLKMLIGKKFGIWSDMAIETTFMRYGHGQNGIIGITLRPETLKTWAYSMHACNKVVGNLDSMRDHEQQKCPSQTHHNEEMKARMKSDGEDRKHL
ncbi:hypothetical protein CgunFtcFv8_002999 [Champsocephalus gunnari]|uniref:Uncharacterized protein n=2 Tax=Champsocephalus gunnari TaxID=52237 RepID=A0AAN8HK28_CHAGU|nr:hypothetical protein CgunFtcFv8_002999 [Champsocephalus gunnari]